MGLWMSRLLSMFGDKEARILVLGLDNAGKTTILCAYAEWDRCGKRPGAHTLLPALTLTLHADRLQVGEVVATIPSEQACPWLVS